MKRNCLIIILGLGLAWSCKDPVELSSQKEILAFTVTGQTAPAVINSLAGTISILVDTNTNLSGIAPQITVSENASINPASGQTVDFSTGPVTYTVTAQNNSIKLWIVTIETIKNHEADILTFYLKQQKAPAVIGDSTVNIVVKIGTSLTALAPDITVSPKATVKPASGQLVDFSAGPLTYTVTAQDSSTKKWVVAVEPAKSDSAEILTFSLSDQKAPAVIGDSTIFIDVKSGTSLTALTPIITVSSKATVTPANMETTDFSAGPVVYNVTAESGVVKHWKVTVTSGGIYGTNILTYTIPNQLGESVIKTSTINITVPIGYDLTSVVPTITVSEGAKIEPESGVTVNFATTGFVTYTVTTASGLKKIWRVYVTEAFISADNPFIQYMGRVDFTNPAKPKLYAPGTGIFVKFKGPYCQILINDQVLYGSNHNYLEIVVDGNQFTRIKTTGPKNTLDLVSNLSDGEHTLLITKATEAGIGYLEFIGFRCNELLEPTPAPERRIEFIGNSITCGYGNDQSQFTCDQGEWYDQHNAYFAYGPETARRLNAQWMLTSVSGIGLIHSCCNMTYEMPDVYEKVNLAINGAAWDFTKYTADAVTICLGQNDGIQDSTIFCGAYVAFIGTVRSKYPNAAIVCITSPMADNNLYNSQKNYLTGIVDYMNNHGDSKVYKHFLSHNLNSGCDYHPNMAEHQQIANELEPFLKETLGW